MHVLTFLFRDAWSAHRSPIFAQKVGLLPRRPAALYGMKTMAGWKTEEDTLLRKLHADGLMPAEMVPHFNGRTKNAIIGRLNRLNLDTRYLYRLKQHEQIELIARLRCHPWNWPRRAIAQAVGVSVDVVGNVVCEHTRPAPDSRRSEAA